MRWLFHKSYFSVCGRSARYYRPAWRRASGHAHICYTKNRLYYFVSMLLRAFLGNVDLWSAVKISQTTARRHRCIIKNRHIGTLRYFTFMVLFRLIFVPLVTAVITSFHWYWREILHPTSPEKTKNHLSESLSLPLFKEVLALTFTTLKRC